MPTISHEFKPSPVPDWEKWALPWKVRTVTEDHGATRWRRLHQTPRGAYYTLNTDKKREPYDGPPPPEAE